MKNIIGNDHFFLMLLQGPLLEPNLFKDALVKSVEPADNCGLVRIKFSVPQIFPGWKEPTGIRLHDGPAQSFLCCSVECDISERSF